MALPVNIEDLLNKRRVESERIEFKEGWNPDKIFRTIDAFANDFNNIGGGYIIIGVEEENGVAKRPVKGIRDDQLDHIEKEIQKYGCKIEPHYLPRISTEQVDDTNVIVLWIPAGNRRPYSVAENVTSKHSFPKWYIRNGSTTVEAKDEVLDELREMANRIPFDERGNANIRLEDINPLLVQDYLRRVGSTLASRITTTNLADILDSMNLYTGPVERRELKNVAAMMFCDTPDRFFPYTQIDVVSFPKGRIADPNNFTEVTFKGPIHIMIWDVLNHLKTTLIKEYVSKPKDRAESIRYFNYPYQAVEEAVVNSCYHRSYQEYEPVEITIEPNRISILNYGGPDHSISDDALHRGQELRTRRYRNRRIGDFLKELDLTEGRSTGIPTIQEELKNNGSAPATFETDARRSFFLIDIPCHPKAEDEQAVDLVTDLVTDLDKVILRLCSTPHSKNEIFDAIHVRSNTYNYRKYIKTLIDKGLLSTTEKLPNSSKQKYQTTAKGIDLVTA